MKTITLPVTTKDPMKFGKPHEIVSLKGPLEYPDECVYCGNPATEKVKLTIDGTHQTTIPDDTPVAVRYSGNMPYCEEHARMTKRFRWIIFGVGFGGIFVPFGVLVISLISTVNDPSSGFVSLIIQFLVGTTLVAVLLLGLMYLTKAILGRINPAAKDFNIDFAGVTGQLGFTSVLQPDANTGFKPGKIQFEFVRDDFAEKMIALNQKKVDEEKAGE